MPKSIISAVADGLPEDRNSALSRRTFLQSTAAAVPAALPALVVGTDFVLSAGAAVAADNKIIELLHAAIDADQHLAVCMKRCDIAAPGEPMRAAEAAIESAFADYNRLRELILVAEPHSLRGVRAKIEFLKLDSVLLPGDDLSTFIDSLLASPALSEGAPANV